MPRKWSRLLFQPFYPGAGNRDKVDCPALPEKPLNIMSDEDRERVEREQRAWSDYYAGIGLKPNAVHKPNA